MVRSIRSTKRVLTALAPIGDPARVNERRVAVGREKWAKRVERWRDSGSKREEIRGRAGAQRALVCGSGPTNWRREVSARSGRLPPHKLARRFVEANPAVAVPQ